MTPTGTMTTAACIVILTEPFLPDWAMIVLIMIVAIITIVVANCLQERAQRRAQKNAIRAALREISPDRCRRRRE